MVVLVELDIIMQHRRLYNRHALPHRLNAFLKHNLTLFVCGRLLLITTTLSQDLAWGPIILGVFLGLIFCS